MKVVVEDKNRIKEVVFKYPHLLILLMQVTRIMD